MRRRRAIVEQFWGAAADAGAPPRDPKTILQEWAQARGLPTPVYREIARTGPHHDPEFQVTVELPELHPAGVRGAPSAPPSKPRRQHMLTREGVEAASDDATD